MSAASEEHSITERQLDDLPRGSKGLCKMAPLLGYKDPLYQLQIDSTCSVGDLLHFLDDNPGAIEALVEWTRENFVDKKFEAKLEPDDMVVSLQKWAYGDSHVELNRDKLMDALDADLNANGDRRMSESECEEFVTGGEEGEISEELKAAFPRTHAFLESHWE